MSERQITEILKGGGFVSVVNEENGFKGFVLGNIASDNKNTIMMFEDWEVNQEYSGRRNVYGATPKKIHDTGWRLGNYYLYHFDDNLEIELHDDADYYFNMIKSRKRKDFNFDKAQSWVVDRLSEMGDK